MDICKAQITVFPEGTAFANAYTSARIRQRYCYKLPATNSKYVANETFCLLTRTMPN